MGFNYSMSRQSCQGNAHEKARAFKSFLLKSLFALSLLRQVKNILPRDNRRAKAEPQPLFLSCRKFYTGSSCYLWPHHSKGHYCLYWGIPKHFGRAFYFLSRSSRKFSNLKSKGTASPTLFQHAPSSAGCFLRQKERQWWSFISVLDLLWKLTQGSNQALPGLSEKDVRHIVFLLD